MHYSARAVFRLKTGMWWCMSNLRQHGVKTASCRHLTLGPLWRQRRQQPVGLTLDACPPWCMSNLRLCCAIVQGQIRSNSASKGAPASGFKPLFTPIAPRAGARVCAHFDGQADGQAARPATIAAEHLTAHQRRPASALPDLSTSYGISGIPHGAHFANLATARRRLGRKTSQWPSLRPVAPTFATGNAYTDTRQRWAAHSPRFRNDPSQSAGKSGDRLPTGGAGGGHPCRFQRRSNNAGPMHAPYAKSQCEKNFFGLRE